jgi:hypothetical protein
VSDTDTGWLPPIPGVQRQDVFPPPPPVLLTGVPVFLGWAGAGPQSPQRLTLWPQFEAMFVREPGATPTAGGFLAAAVRGFFENDGALCQVLRLRDELLPADALTAALRLLDDLDDIDLVCAPDLVSAVWSREKQADEEERARLVAEQQSVLLRYCRERGDLFALLDAVPSAGTAAVAAQAAALTGPDGSHGALYHPWLATPGTVGSGGHVPPCGHVAGTYSAGDRSAGVHRAPANRPVEGVVDLRSDVLPGDVAALYAQGVNCLRALPGRGFRVWGSRTLSGDPAWRDVPTRRLVATIGRWVEQFMVRLVHEPNDVRLWVRIMRELTGYLDGLFQRGALSGRTAEEAFYVKCDHETNPPEVVAAGIVVTRIGVAPAAPAEFVTVRVVHGASGVTVDAA